MISMIAAVASNGALGLDNRLLYWLPNDLKRFKQLTTGHTIVMGRRTFDSLPKGALPNRRNVVVSASMQSLPGAEVYPSLDEALQACAADDEVFVIGGASIYRQAYPLAQRLYLTEVDDVPAAADVFFPDMEGNEWEQVACEPHEKDERHAFAYRFVDYIRKGPLSY